MSRRAGVGDWLLYPGPPCRIAHPTPQGTLPGSSPLGPAFARSPLAHLSIDLPLWTARSPASCSLIRFFPFKSVHPPRTLFPSVISHTPTTSLSHILPTTQPLLLLPHGWHRKRANPKCPSRPTIARRRRPPPSRTRPPPAPHQVWAAEQADQGDGPPEQPNPLHGPHIRGGKLFEEAV